MNKLLIAFFSLTLTLAFSVDQESSRRLIKKDARILQNKPTVFLSFEKAGLRKPVHASESDQGIWLRLHNNTPWAINMPTQSFGLLEKTPLRLEDGRNVLALRSGVEIMSCHGVEALFFQKAQKATDRANGGYIENPKAPVGYNRGSDVTSTSWLPSGSSVIFSVPREHLASNLTVYVSYKYDWETAEGDDGSKEPEHRVYFRSVDLPPEITNK